MSGQSELTNIGVSHLCPTCGNRWTCFLHSNCGNEVSTCPICDDLAVARDPKVIAKISSLTIWRRRDTWESLHYIDARRGDRVTFKFNGEQCEAFIEVMIDGSVAQVNMRYGKFPYTVLELNRTIER